ncbi:MAG TPA: hypothetical protein DCS93_20865 [Microscillaceae bacterium]|nr:hypothetical protein [Microscillaceae bacterium]
MYTHLPQIAGIWLLECLQFLFFTVIFVDSPRTFIYKVISNLFLTKTVEDLSNLFKLTLESEWNTYGMDENIDLKLSVEFSQNLLPDARIEILNPQKISTYPPTAHQATPLQKHSSEVFHTTEDLVYTFFQNTIAFAEAGFYQISCNIPVRVSFTGQSPQTLDLSVSHSLAIRKYLTLAEIDDRICDLLWQEHCISELSEAYYRKKYPRSDEDIAKEFEAVEARIKALSSYIARSDFDKMPANDFSIETILRLSFYHPEDDTIARAKKYLANPEFYQLDQDDIQMAQTMIQGNY